jgi:hypothetical protein
MSRLWRYLSLLMAVVLTFSLIGCSSASVTSQNIESEVKQNVEENETEVESVIVSKTSDEQVIKKESSSNDNDESTKAEEASSTETKKELTSTVTEDKTKQEEVLSKNETEKTETEKTETTAKKDKENLSKTTSSKEVTQKDPKTTTVKVTTEPKQTETKPTVSIMIIGPKDVGVILPKTKVTLSEGDTVLDVLLKVAKKKNLLVEHSGSGAMAYLEGIDNIYEFDYGPKSGWEFKLNDAKISKSSGIVKVKKDDQIKWVYSEDFTEDNE